jgi:hypothetical protein
MKSMSPESRRKSTYVLLADEDAAMVSWSLPIFVKRLHILVDSLVQSSAWF